MTVLILACSECGSAVVKMDDDHFVQAFREWVILCNPCYKRMRNRILMNEVNMRDAVKVARLVGANEALEACTKKLEAAIRGPA